MADAMHLEKENMDRSNSSAEEEHAIKTMQLYMCPETRVANELAARGLRDAAVLSADVVHEFDSLHYFGNDAVDAAAARLALTKATRVLDVGSGLGGPARRLAATTGCSVAALELQADYGRAAAALTRRCGLTSVEHVTGDVLTKSLAVGPFDCVVSWLCFLHVPDKARLLDACAARLAPGGALFVEDYFAASPLTAAEKASLARDVAAPALPSRAAYEAALAGAGFVDVEWTDMTASWTTYVADRLAAYEAKRATVVKVHGAAVYDAQLAFFRAVDALFRGGRLGGVRYVARKA